MSWGLVDGRMLVHVPHGIGVSRADGPAPPPSFAARPSGRHRMRFAELDGPPGALKGRVGGVDDQLAIEIADDPGVGRTLSHLTVICRPHPEHGVGRLSDAGLHDLLRIPCALDLDIRDTEEITPAGLASLPPRSDVHMRLSVPAGLADALRAACPEALRARTQIVAMKPPQDQLRGRRLSDLQDDRADAAAHVDMCRAQDALRQADRVLILTGAGISRSAGIPTFADLETQDPVRLAWLRSSIDCFHQDPCAVWGLLEERRQHALSVALTPAHEAIAQWMAAHPQAWIATQNVDGLHERAARECEAAGEADRILRLHGSLHHSRCLDCSRTDALPARIDSSALLHLPVCSACGGRLRPDIVWFGEMLSEAILESAQQAATVAQVCLIIGTRLDVHPAGFLPKLAHARGALVIEVNPRPALTNADRVIVLPMTADAGVPDLLGMVQA
jgi:NAD-dependent deacetylase